MSIKADRPLEPTNCNCSVPTTIKPFDVTVQGYTVEEYLISIATAMIFSRGVKPVNKAGHHQWKAKKQH